MRDEHRARRVTDHALRYAAEQQAPEAAMPVRADGDEVMRARFGGMRDDGGRRALHELHVQRVAEVGIARDHLVGLGLRAGEHRVTHRRPREASLAQEGRAP